MNQCLTGGKPEASHGHHANTVESGGSRPRGDSDGYEKVASKDQHGAGKKGAGSGGAGSGGAGAGADKAKPVAAVNPESAVAFSIWLGILIDGVPEAMLIGFMQSEGELSIAFIVAVFLANFPEAMSASTIM